MALTWVRSLAVSQPYVQGSTLLASLNNGQTLVRVRFSWGFNGYSSLDRHLKNSFAAAMAFGIVTTIGDGTETVPSAQPPASNIAPPTQRWVWWTARSPIIVSDPGNAERFIFTDSGPDSEEDAEGQVLATGVPVGKHLNVWASWWPAGAWDPNGQAWLWCAASVGIL